MGISLEYHGSNECIWMNYNLGRLDSQPSNKGYVEIYVCMYTMWCPHTSKLVYNLINYRL